jgi:hypothetical protein
MKVAFALCAAAFAAFIACSGDAGDGAGVPGAEPDLVSAPAPIERVEINVAESFPPQYFVDIVSGLPNGCARFDSIETNRSGDTIRIVVLNRVPGPGSIVACTMIYGTVQHHVALSTDFEPGRTYTVVVNDVLETFQAQ